MIKKAILATLITNGGLSLAEEPKVPILKSHWLAPLDIITRSDPDPFAKVDGESFTTEQFLKICKGEVGEILWIIAPGRNLVTRKYSRYAVIKEQIHRGDSEDPFSSDDGLTTYYYITIQRVLVDGKFKEKQRFGLSEEQATAFEMLGRVMTAEVGYPHYLESSRFSSPFSFGFKMNDHHQWAYGQGATPRNSILKNVIYLLNRLPSSSPERTLPRDIATTLESIKGSIRAGCAQITKKKTDQVKTTDAANLEKETK